MKKNIVLPTEKIISVISTTVVPAIINLCATFIVLKYSKNISDLASAIIVMVSALVSALMVFLLYNYIPRIRSLRPFWQYEGRWLQIIPDFKRQASIIDLKYDKRKMQYKLQGVNFDINNLNGNGVGFTAHKFIERDYHDGFYYITNHTIEHKNGLGKIGFFETNFDNLIRAEGYFFDSAGKTDCSKKYRTIMIKCDDNFFQKVCPDNGEYFDICKIPPLKILEISTQFILDEIKNHKLIKTHSEEQVHNNDCEHCPLNSVS